MKTAGHLGLLLIMLVIGACSSADPPLAPSPGPSAAPSPAPGPPAAPAEPSLQPGELPQPGTYAYIEAGAPARYLSTTTSRWVLSGDGRFTLQYEGVPGMPGRYSYSSESGLVTFIFDVSGEPWNAKGSVQSDLLTIVFSEMLQHADFEGATYKRVP